MTTPPITLELRQKGDRTEIEIRVLNPMEPGDALPQKSGHARAPWFLRSMVVQLNGKTLVEGQLSASLTKDPRLGFTFSSIKTGDKFTVYCTDNKGQELKSEVVAQFSRT